MAAAVFRSTPEATPRPARFYVPELDALRFFAFAAVFVHHCLMTYMNIASVRSVAFMTLAQFGAWGVDFFFCLSAYLITELLTRERNNTGTISVRAFYERRALRIWPLYFTFLAALAAVQMAAGRIFVPWIYFIFSVSMVGNIPIAIHIPSAAILPLWSLSVEEQFYAIWPWIVKRAAPRSLIFIATALWFGSIYYRARYAFDGSFGDPIWFSTRTRLDPIAAGILLSLLLGGRTQLQLKIARPVLIASALAAVAFASFCHAIDETHAGVPMLFGYPLAALGCAGILLASIGSGAPFLLSPRLRGLGEISYGLYVIHGSMIALFASRFVDLDSPVKWLLIPTCALIATTILAAISHRWIETPFNNLRRRLQ